jgi:type II restriction enzyme
MKSEHLRKVFSENGGGRLMNNEKSKILEKGVSGVVLKIKNILQEKYPEYTLLHTLQLSKNEIAEEIGAKDYKPSNEKSSIRPDGGILFVKINENYYPILIAEAKQQGTNDARRKEGKKSQAKGNAIERSAKNFLELQLYCKNLSYFPYVIFVSGCDFEKGSSILDRLDCLTHYKPRNKIYVKDESKIATVFVKNKTFSTNEIYNVMSEVAEISIKEAIKKYDK